MARDSVQITRVMAGEGVESTGRIRRVRMHHELHIAQRADGRSMCSSSVLSQAERRLCQHRNEETPHSERGRHTAVGLALAQVPKLRTPSGH